LLDLDFGPGDESLEVQLFEETEVPWDRLAFPVIVETLKLYYADRANGGFRSHMGDIVRAPGASLRHYQVTMLGVNAFDPDADLRPTPRVSD
jgi:hypothetical protein